MKITFGAFGISAVLLCLVSLLHACDVLLVWKDDCVMC